MRSLVWKLSLTFWLVSLTGIVLVALIASRLVGTQSAEFESQINKTALAGRVTDFYINNNGWSGRQQQERRLSQDDDLAWFVVDKEGKIVLRSRTNGSDLRRNDLDDFEERYIQVEGDTVGVLFVDYRGSPNQQSREVSAARQTFLTSIQNSIILSAIGATVLSLLLGIGFARRLTRPIQELTTATRQVAAGNLNEKVAVRSEDELGELAQAFNQMSQDLSEAQLAQEQATQARQQMTADIAHDLRTPLSIIQGHTEGLKDGVLPANEETYSIIHDETLRLNRLVEDLRTLSLADAGELPLALRPVAVRNLLERTLMAYSPLAEEDDVHMDIVLTTEDEVLVDTDRMAQVLDNLVSNALRFAPKNSEVRLSARSDQQQVFIGVQDEGHGISAEHLPHVFDRFYRVDQSRQRENGSTSGLGLAISKSVVEQHGGTISVESTVGEGTAFTISLPITHNT